MANVDSLKPDAVGVGLRPKFYSDLDTGQDIDYLEIISENYMFDQPVPNSYLEKFKGTYPIVLHGVSLNLLGSEELDRDYLDRLRRLADRLQVSFFSDHLCWSQRGQRFHHDLLPTPYRSDLLSRSIERAQFVQDYLGRPFAIENLSSYITFNESDMSEWDFYSAVVKQSGCNFLLDINNIYVSGCNHGFNPKDYIDSIDFSKVKQVHLAGHDSSQPGLIVDTHDRPVVEEVWSLYKYAWDKGGPFPTLIEWDENIPDLATVLREAQRAKQVRL
jgi:hypothetical protein